LAVPRRAGCWKTHSLFLPSSFSMRCASDSH
jgi:hypothetical protein